MNDGDAVDLNLAGQLIVHNHFWLSPSLVLAEKRNKMPQCGDADRPSMAAEAPAQARDGFIFGNFFLTEGDKIASVYCNFGRH